MNAPAENPEAEPRPGHEVADLDTTTDHAVTCLECEIHAALDLCQRIRSGKVQVVSPIMIKRLSEQLNVCIGEAWSGLSHATPTERRC